MQKKCSSLLIFLSLYQFPEVINSSIKIELTTPPEKRPGEPVITRFPKLDKAIRIIL